jgi:hypothetical protein
MTVANQLTNASSMRTPLPSDRVNEKGITTIHDRSRYLIKMNLIVRIVVNQIVDEGPGHHQTKASKPETVRLPFDGVAAGRERDW